MKETKEEIINRLKLMLNAEDMPIVEPKNFYSVCEKYQISQELGLKFLVKSCIDKKLKDLTREVRFEYTVTLGLASARDRFGAKFKLRLNESDSLRICREIRASAARFKDLGHSLSIDILFNNPEYSVWWKSLHFPILERYGWFDEKIKRILHEHKLGKMAKIAYDESMYPYSLGYWLMKRRLNNAKP